MTTSSFPKRATRVFFPLLAVFFLFQGGLCLAVPTEKGKSEKPILLVQGNSQVLHLKNKMEKIAIGNPNVLDARPITPNDVMFQGISIGRSNVHIWEKGGRRYTISIISISPQYIQSQLPMGVTARVDEKAGIVTLEGEVQSESEINNALVSLENQFGDIFENKVEIVPPPPPPPPLPDEFFTVDEDSDEGSLDMDGVALQTKMFPIKSRPAADIQAAITPLLSSNGFMQVDSRTNILIVRDVEENMETLEKFINELDQPTNLQVLIEARFIEVKTDYLDELGIDWGATFTNPLNPAQSLSVAVGQPTQSISGNPNATVLGTNLPSEIGLDASSSHISRLDLSNLDIKLKALENKGFLKTLSSPRVTTLNQQTATINLTQREPYIARYDFTYDANGNIAGITPVVEFIDLGISLEITPNIGKDDVITVSLTPSVSDEVLPRFQPSVSIGGSNFTFEVPRQVTRIANAQILIKNGYTFVLGGLKSHQDNDVVQRVPGLSKLPFVGDLFKHTRRDIDARELLIFVTAQIIDDKGNIKIFKRPEYIPPGPLKDMYLESQHNPALNQEAVNDSNPVTIPPQVEEEEEEEDNLELENTTDEVPPPPPVIDLTK